MSFAPRPLSFIPPTAGLTGRPRPLPRQDAGGVKPRLPLRRSRTRKSVGPGFYKSVLSSVVPWVSLWGIPRYDPRPREKPVCAFVPVETTSGAECLPLYRVRGERAREPMPRVSASVTALLSLRHGQVTRTESPSWQSFTTRRIPETTRVIVAGAPPIRTSSRAF